MHKIEKIENWYALIHFNKETKLYTVSSKENGGAVITNEDLSIAKKEFVQSMKLAEGLVKLERFSEHGNFNKPI